MEIQNLESPSYFVQKHPSEPEKSDNSIEPIFIKSSVKAKLERNLQQIKIQKLTEIPKIEIKDETNQGPIGCQFQKVREFLETILMHRVMKNGYLFLLILFMVLCLLQDPLEHPDSYFIFGYIEMGCHGIFLVVGVLKCIEWKHTKIIWIALEIVTSICGIIGLSLQNQEIGRYFKALRTLKLIFLITEVQIFNQPATHLLVALAKVRNIFIPMIVIMYVYAVIGLRAFVDFQYSKCRNPANLALSQNWTVFDQDIYLCGERECPSYDGILYQCLNPIDYSVDPNPDQLVNIVQGNGLMTYGNIQLALFSTIKQTFITGSSRLIILYKQAMSPYFVQFYYFTYIILISYVYLNIFYSRIIMIEWDNDESANQENMDKKEKIKNEIEKIDNKDNKRERGLTRPAKEKKIVSQRNVSKSEGCEAESFEKINNGSQQGKLRVSQIIQGTLELQKARVFNVFDEIDHEPQMQQIPKIQSHTYIQDQDSWKKIQKTYTIVNHIFIILTCINLSLDYHNQDATFKFFVDCIDFGFLLVISLMVLAKIVLERIYLRRIQLYTKIDIGIIIVSYVGVIYEAVVAQNVQDFLSADEPIDGVFRSFKYLRIFLLILSSFYFQQARLILQSTIRSVYHMKNVFGLWLIIVILFSICGYHLHSYKTKVDSSGKLDLQNGTGFQLSFDGIFSSFIFTVLTFYNEEWDYLLFQQYLGSRQSIVLWQILSLLFGLILFSKYFMSLLMNELDNIIDEKLDQASNLNSIFTEKEPQQREQSQQQYQDNKIHQQQSKFSIKFKAGDIDLKKVTFAQATVEHPSALISKKKKNLTKKVSTEKEKNHDQQICIKKFLHFLKRIVESTFYKISWVLMIILSFIVVISLNPHILKWSDEMFPYRIIDNVVKTFFLVDVVVKICIYNVCMSENSYFRRSWLNWMNIVIVVLELMSHTEIGENQIFMKIEKIKVLRILFLIEMKYKADWNMRITFESLIQLLPKVCTLLTITIVIYSYFALVLVKVYKNQFYECHNYPETATIVSKYDCLSWGGDWVQSVMNTSNLFQSTLYLFLVATTQGWISMMQPAMNFTGPDLQPVLDTNKYISIFFIAFFFFGNLIMLNVFIGLSVSNMKRLKDICTGEAELSAKQKMWLAIKTQIYRLQPLVLVTKPSNKLRGICFLIATHWVYKIFQAMCFIGLLIAMSFYHSNQSDFASRTLNIIQYFFIGLLLFQYFLEVSAFGMRKEYKKSFFMKTFASIYSVIFVIINEASMLEKSTIRILGALNVALQLITYLSLLDDIPFANKMLNSLLTVFPRASNILLLLFSTLFIYTIIGIELFAFLKPGVELDDFNQNYTSFGNALFALVKFSTMQSPIQQISDAARTIGPDFICQEVYYYSDFLTYGQTGCGNPFSAYIFFLSFHIFYSLLLFSTLIAVIVDSYGEVYKEENAYITKFLLRQVQNAWSKIDPEASGYIPYRQFWMFTAKLIEIYSSKNTEKTAKESFNELYASREKFLNDISIPIYENERGVLCFQFHEVIEGLTRVYLKNTIGSKMKTNKTEKMFRQRVSSLFTGFKRSFYKSQHVTTLIILKTGLRWWKNSAATSNKMLEYKTMISKFSFYSRQNNPFPSLQPKKKSAFEEDNQYEQEELE